MFESTEIEPIAAELGGECANARVAEEAVSLPEEHVTMVKVAGGSVLEEFFIRHRGPEEIAEPVGERVVVEWLDVWAASGGIGAIAEGRRHQDANKAFADRFFMLEAALGPERFVKGYKIVALVTGERAPVGALREMGERGEMNRFCREMRAFDPTDAILQDAEMIRESFDDAFVLGVAMDLLHVDLDILSIFLG